jgi:hypothetical protein
MITTPGRILLEEVVPDDMRDDLDVPLNKKGASAFFDKLARRHPDKYVDVMHGMTRLADEVSTEYGRWTSLSLNDLELPPQTKKFREALRMKVETVAQNDRLSSQQKADKIVGLLKDSLPMVKTLLEDEGVGIENAFAMSSKHGIRGNPTQLMQMLFGDVLVADNSGRPVPVPVLHGYVEGLTPIETWAGSYGSRKGYSCLWEYTQVRMFDGSCKAIRDVVVGDVVLGSDLRGMLKPVTVTAVLDQGLQYTYLYVFDASTSLVCTAEHKVLKYTDTGFVVEPIGEPSIHLRAVSACGTEIPAERKLGRAAAAGQVRTLDLTVDSSEHLFVLANGLVVSNSVQFATADTGYFAKQMAHMNTGMQVTAEDCGTTEGLPIDPRSEEAAGRFVAQSAAGVKAGTVLDSDTTRRIRDKEVVVRSPLTCKLPHGVCQKCAGLRPDGRLPSLNSFVSLEASRVITEPMTQKLALRAKHVGGQVGINDRDATGFEEVDQFVQVPETFKGAVLSEADGTVKSIEPAPQGGTYVSVGDQQYHVPTGRQIVVKKGATVQAGDALTDGTLNPADVARYRGIGEGRRYFVDQYSEILKRNGVPALRNNLEMLARSYIQNVRVTDPEGVAGYRFGEVLPYESLQERWVPRGGAQKQRLGYVLDQYLEEPAAHYTIGTRITPAVVETLQKRGIKEVIAHKDPPGFEPQVTRAAARSLDEQDWKARLGGFYLKNAFEDIATLGAVDEPEGRTSTFAAIMDPSRLKEVR